MIPRPSDKVLDKLAACEDQNRDLYREILSNPAQLCHPIMVQCRPWVFGFSKGRPILREGSTTRHPVHLYYGGAYAVRRVCTQTACCNPFHFSTHPLPPSRPRHPLSLEAEGLIQPRKSLAESIRDLGFPPHYTIEAYVHLRSIGRAH
jgi:hypothetical protein